MSGVGEVAVSAIGIGATKMAPLVSPAAASAVQASAPSNLPLASGITEHSLIEKVCRKALSKGVKLLWKQRHRKLKFDKISDSDYTNLDTEKCNWVFICSVPFDGVIGILYPPARHYLAVMVSAEIEDNSDDYNENPISETDTKSTALFKFLRNGYNAGRLKAMDVYKTKAFAFEFGLEGEGHGVDGDSAIALTSCRYNFEVPKNRWSQYAYKNDPSFPHRDALKRAGLKIHERQACDVKLSTAIDWAIAAGVKRYSLKEYNCRSYAMTVANAIATNTLKFIFDDKYNQIAKRVAYWLNKSSVLHSKEEDTKAVCYWKEHIDELQDGFDEDDDFEQDESKPVQLMGDDDVSQVQVNRKDVIGTLNAAEAYKAIVMVLTVLIAVFLIIAEKND